MRFFQLAENIELAFIALIRNKLRTLLTLLGLIIGITSVITMIALISGMNQSIRQQVESLGTNAFFVFKYAQGPRTLDDYKPRKNITLQDAWAIREKCSLVRFVTPTSYSYRRIKAPHDREYYSYSVCGTDQTLPETEAYFPQFGRFLSAYDVEHATRSAVLGYNVWQALANKYQTNLLGAQVYVGSHPFRIIGLLEKKGNMLGRSQDDILFIPITSFQSIFGRHRNVNLTVQPFSKADEAGAIGQVRSLLRSRRRVELGDADNFGIVTQDSLMNLWHSISGGIFFAGFGITLLALLVGGIGIMNIMLVSVKERTREIGIRKSIGATRHDIAIQFVAEAIVMSLLGGFLGMVFGFGLAKAGEKALSIPAAIPLWGVLVGVSFSIAVGLVFGIYPAVKASRLDPIEALRYE